MDQFWGGASNGLVYDSVRLRGAWNLAAFRPRPLASKTGAAHVIEGSHYFLMWDGTRIDRTIEVGQPEWQPLAPAGA